MSRVSFRTLLFTTGLIFACRLSAQVPLPTTPPVVPPPAVAPALPPGMLAPGVPPAAPVPAAPPQNEPAIPGAEQTVRLQMLDANVTDILELYSRLTHRRLIYSTQLAGPIRIAISEMVPQSEAIKIIEMTLLMNGFNIVPTEEPKIWKVTAAGQNPKSVGIPFVDR